MFASDKNLKLEAKNKKLVKKLAEQKAQAKTVVGRMRQDMVELHMQAGKSEFSAGFQSVLATDDNKEVAKFLDPEIEVSPSKSIGLSSALRMMPMKLRQSCGL